MAANKNIITSLYGNEKELSTIMGIGTLIGWIFLMTSGSQWLYSGETDGTIVAWFRSVLLLSTAITMLLEVFLPTILDAITRTAKVIIYAGCMLVLSVLVLIIGSPTIFSFTPSVFIAAIICGMGLTLIAWSLLERHADKPLSHILIEGCAEIITGLLLYFMVSYATFIVGLILLAALPLVACIFLWFGFVSSKVFSGGDISTSVAETHISPIKLSVSVVLFFYIVCFHKAVVLTKEGVGTLNIVISTAWIIVLITLLLVAGFLTLRPDAKLNMDLVYMGFIVLSIFIAVVIVVFGGERSFVSVLVIWIFDVYIAIFGIVSLFATWQQTALMRKRITVATLVALSIVGILVMPVTLDAFLYNVLIPAAIIPDYMLLAILIFLVTAINVILRFTNSNAYPVIDMGQNLDNQGEAYKQGTSWEEAVEKCSDSFALSSREQDVLLLIVQGFSAENVGDRLNISVYTVRSHCRNLYSKMDVHSRSELRDVVDNTRTINK